MTEPPEIYVGPPAVAPRHGDLFSPPARYRHPGDLIRLIIAGLVLAVTLTANSKLLILTVVAGIAGMRSAAVTTGSFKSLVTSTRRLSCTGIDKPWRRVWLGDRGLMRKGALRIE